MNAQASGYMLYSLVFVVLFIAPFIIDLASARVRKSSSLFGIIVFFCWGMIPVLVFFTEVADKENFVVTFDDVVNGRVTDIGKVVGCVTNCVNVPKEMQLNFSLLSDNLVTFSGVVSLEDLSLVNLQQVADVIGLRPKKWQEDEHLPVPLAVFNVHLLKIINLYFEDSEKNSNFVNERLKCGVEKDYENCSLFASNVIGDFKERLKVAGLKFTMEGKVNMDLHAEKFGFTH